MRRIILSGMAATLLSSTYVFAEEKKTVDMVSEQLSGSAISFPPKDNVVPVSVTISGPDGYHNTFESQMGLKRVALDESSSLRDGLYHYEITSIKGPLMLIQDNMNNGRGENNKVFSAKGVLQSGHFRVKNGVIKTYEDLKESTSSIRFQGY